MADAEGMIAEVEDVEVVVMAVVSALMAARDMSGYDCLE
jgi:hypothetical protein